MPTKRLTITDTKTEDIMNIETPTNLSESAAAEIQAIIDREKAKVGAIVGTNEISCQCGLKAESFGMIFG